MPCCERRLRGVYHVVRDVASLARTCKAASEAAMDAWRHVSDECTFTVSAL